MLQNKFYQIHLFLWAGFFLAKNYPVYPQSSQCKNFECNYWLITLLPAHATFPFLFLHIKAWFSSLSHATTSLLALSSQMAAHFARYSKFQQDIYPQKQLFNQEVTLSSRVQWPVFNDQLIRIFKVKLSWHHCTIFQLIHVVLWQCNEKDQKQKTQCINLTAFMCQLYWIGETHL